MKVRVAIDGKPMIHAPGVAPGCATLCGLRVDHRIVATPVETRSRSARIGCRDCWVVWRRMLRLTKSLRDRSFAETIRRGRTDDAISR